jgi:integrase
LSDPEEKRLHAAIERRFAEFLPHLLLSIDTRMRMSEQYSLRCNHVDFECRQLDLIRAKNGDSRSIPLDAIALCLGGASRAEGRENPPGTVLPSLL